MFSKKVFKGCKAPLNAVRDQTFKCNLNGNTKTFLSHKLNNIFIYFLGHENVKSEMEE